MVSFLFVLFLVVLVLLSCAWGTYVQRENDRLQKALNRYDRLSSQEDFIEQLNLDLRKKQRQLASLTESYEHLMSKYDRSLSQDELNAQLSSSIQKKQGELSDLVRTQEHFDLQISNLEQKLNRLREEEALQSLGFYEPKYDFITSDLYQEQFDYVVSERKKMIKNGTAAICRKTWAIGEDVKKGKRMIADYLKLLRGTFDNTCDAAISNARSNNIQQLEKNIRSAFDRLNKWSKTLECEITTEYLKLWLRELDLKYEMEIKKQEERDRDKLIREQIAKEKKEREAIEKTRQEEEEAAQRRIRHQQEIERIRQEMEKSVGQQRKDLELQMQELEKLRSKAQADQEDAIKRRRKLKSGFIYVISSMGSFEPGIYRICVTQSNDPDKYIRDMNPVTPFPFNIYFKIFSDEIEETSKFLYQYFHDRRVNKINFRREFFRVTLDEIDQAIREYDRRHPGKLKNIQRFDAIPLADEYRWSRSAEQRDDHSSSSNTVYSNDEIA